MVREWYHRSRSSMRRGESRQSPGCMAHVLHLFDLHTKQEEVQQPQDSVHLEAIFLKGLEAPRNSLELEQRSAMAPPSCSSSSSFAALKDDDNYFIPFSVQLPPLRPSTSSERDQRSEPCKTPGVVARLMGLELLPQDTRRSSAASSPVFRRPSFRRPKGSSSSTSRHESGTRSLPDTPRISSARRSVDVDHRLSLHLNKENTAAGATPEFDYHRVFSGDPSWNYSSPPLPPRRASRKRESRLKSGNDDNPSPRRHATNIVGRRVVGADITNIISSNIAREKQSPPMSHLKKARRSARPSEEAVQTKHTILPNPSSSSPSPSPSPSSPFLSSLSPRVRMQELARNRTTAAAEDRSLKPLKSTKELSYNKLSKYSRPRPQPKPAAAIIKCRKASCERFTSKPRRSPPPPDSITCLPHDVLTKPKKWQILQGTGVVRSREDPPGLLLSASSSEPSMGPPYDDGPTAGPLAARDDHTVSAEFQYLRAILQLVGIEARGPVTASFARWYSPAHPLDPALFHSLERAPSAAGSLGPSPFRRLIFNLADELLAVVLRPNQHLKPWLPSARRPTYATPPTGAQLLDRVWTRVRSFPRANCQTLQDIDELVGSDLPEVHEEEGQEEEWEAVVGEIERWILDSLIGEAAEGLCRSRSASD